MELEQHAFANHWVTEEISKEIQKYLDSNEIENKTYQNLWDTAKAGSV
jgi:hypothetical protein